MPFRPQKHLVELALLAFSLAFSFAIFEAGYRMWLAHDLSRSAPNVDRGKAENFSAASASFLREDKKYGLRFNQGKQEYLTAYVANGVFDRCEAFTFRADRPDASGPLPNDPADAALRILVFGDSFTAVQWNEETWPSLMQRELESRLGIKVSVLNLARHGIGVLQMIDHAALAVPEMRPDAYVVAYITNDLIRPRFWLLERRTRGRERLVLSTEQGEGDDPRILAKATDFVQVNPGITTRWCDRMAAAKAAGHTAPLRDDPVVADLLVQRRDLLSDHDRPLFRVDLWTLRASLVLNRIVFGNAFHNMALKETRGSYNRIEIDSFEADAGFRRAITTLKGTGIPGFPVHIPHQYEIIDGREFDYPRAGGTTHEQGAGLTQSLEKLMGVPSVPLLEHLGAWRADPGAHIWKPDDHHPNRKGIEALSKAVADALIERGIGSFARR